MKGERVLQTLLLATVGLALFGWIKPESPDPREDSGSQRTWFFINKTHQVPVYDAVLIGDSRGLRGVSGEALGEILPGMRFFNFSFHAGGMNREMFQEGENLLDENAETPVVILAPTALSFLPSKAANAQFHEYRNKPRDQVWAYMKLPGLAHWFQPVTPSVPVRKMFGDQPAKTLIQDFRADGWIGTDQFPPDDLTDLTIHRERLVGRQSDDARIADFMEQTRVWTGRGIRVFGFFPPANESRLAQEDSMLGFDQEAFVSSFEAAGGVWLNLGQGAYRSYDGSHLDRESARDLSRDLGRELAPYLAGFGSP